MVWVFSNQLSVLPLKKYNLFLTAAVLVSFLAGCGSSEHAVEVVKEPGAGKTIPYPSRISYSPEPVKSLKLRLNDFMEKTHSSYDVAEPDSLLMTVRHLQYGNPHASLFPGIETGQKDFSVEELDAGIRALFSNWKSLFNTDGNDLKLISAEDNDEFVHFIYKKQFPKDFPFVNPEFNVVEVMVSVHGEIGYLSSTAVPEREMPAVNWADPEKGRRELVQHKISYEKSGRTQVYVIQNQAVISGGVQSALILIRRKANNTEIELKPYNIELSYHYAWEYLITPEEGKPAVFKVYIDAITGEVLESLYLGT